MASPQPERRDMRWYIAAVAGNYDKALYSAGCEIARSLALNPRRKQSEDIIVYL